MQPGTSSGGGCEGLPVLKPAGRGGVPGVVAGASAALAALFGAFDRQKKSPAGEAGLVGGGADLSGDALYPQP
jgi:hypothetical protein